MGWKLSAGGDSSFVPRQLSAQVPPNWAIKVRDALTSPPTVPVLDF